jgi:glycosyltransferase involved in cell wall biosynthesis
MAELNRLGGTFQNARLYGLLASRLETHALGLTNGVFCNSAYTEALVAPRARQAWRIPNAIRGCFFREPASVANQHDVPLLLNVGHLGIRKRQLEILRIAAELHGEGHCFKIVFTGGMPTGDEYGRTFAAEMRQAERAGFASHAGFLNANDLISLMDQACGFVHFPSEEAFGLVVAEAMARGLKFFGANLGGIKEIGAGIPGAELHDDFFSLKAGIVRWLKAGAPRCPEAGSIIRQRYSPIAVAIRHLEIYQEVLL